MRDGQGFKTISKNHQPVLRRLRAKRGSGGLMRWGPFRKLLTTRKINTVRKKKSEVVNLGGPPFQPWKFLVGKNPAEE